MFKFNPFKVNSLASSSSGLQKITFGFVTDVHQADKDPSSNRYYRDAVDKLTDAVSVFNARNDLRFIYQQLKNLTHNVSQLKKNNIQEEDEEEEEIVVISEEHNKQIYLPPNHLIRKKQSQVTCTFPDEYTTSKFHNMPTIQRR